MASVYNKNGILYVSWWDRNENKTKNRSLKMKATTANKRTANDFAKKLQKELDKQKDENGKSLLTKGSTIKKAFDHFKENNATKHYKTIKDYDRFYSKFTESFGENSPCSTISKISAENWINELKKLPFSKNTIHGYYKNFSHFLNFLFEYSYIPMFKINQDVKTKAEVKEKIVFTDDDILKIFSNLKDKKQNFRTMIYFLFYTGLRPSDIYKIKVGDIDTNTQMVKYYSQKRKEYREIPFHNELIPILNERIGLIKQGSLFGYSDYSYMGKSVTRFFQKIGLTGKNCSAKTFRKTFITLARSRHKMDETVVKELVGHRHTSTTDKYYNRVDVDTMKKELKKFKMPVPEEKKSILNPPQLNKNFSAPQTELN